MPDQIPLTQQQPFDLNKGLGAISSLVGIRQQQQDLQTGQYRQASAKAESEQANQKNLELQAAQKAIFTGANQGRYTKEDGSFDSARAANDVMSVAPTYGGEASRGLLSNANELVQNKQAVQNLTDSQRKSVGTTLQSLAADPDLDNSKIIDAVSQLREQNKDPGFNRLLDSTLMHMPQGASPQQLQQAISTMAGSMTQTSPVSATTIDNGPNIQPGTQNNATGRFNPAGAPLRKDVAPALGSTTGGAPAVITGSGVRPLGMAGGAQAPPQKPPGAPRTAQDDAPPGNAPAVVQQNYAKAAETARQHVEDVRKADEGYGNSMAVSDAIRKLSSNTATGFGTNAYHTTMGVLGIPFGKDAAADSQLLNAYLDRQAAGLRSQMGLPGTNAGAEDAKNIAGNTSYQGTAIRDKNDYNQALSEGVHQYRRGLDRIEAFTGQPSPVAVQKFRSAWADNFDPNVFRGELAFKRSKEDGEAFMKTLSPQEAASISAKRKALKALSEGQLP